MAGGILAKTGLDTLKIGGHKVPIALIGGAAAVVTVVLVLRARSQGAQVASVGQAPFTAAGTGFGLPAPGADVGPALANLSQQLTALQQGTPLAAQAPRLTPNLGDVPIWLHSSPSAESGVAAVIRPGSTLTPAGPAVQGGSFTSPQLGITGSTWIPLAVNGVTEYAFAPEVAAI